MVAAKISARQKMITAATMRSGFFLPKKTAASAIHPRPLEILGTKEQSLSVSKVPASEP